MKINKESIKQISLIFWGIVLIYVGYINYIDDFEYDSIQIAGYENEINIGDVQLVNSEPAIENNTITGIVPNEDIDNTSKENIDDNLVTDLNNNYFDETRIERERMYSETIEIYQKIINNPETPSDQKAISVQEITNITNVKNGIMISENLIKNKGFEDVVILENNGAVSVIVKSYSLNKEQISKIQNIVERELNVDVKKINISNKF